MAEPGPITPYESQLRFLRELDIGLSEGQHFFVCLKSRQLGISTFLLALDIFWLFMFPGLRGALIADNDENRDAFRDTITEMLDSLPFGFKIEYKRNNRKALTLQNGSTLYYLAAGKGKNPDLGRSKGLSFVHGTEVATWGDQDGLHSLIDALAVTNPNRLYAFESTARGYNTFNTMYEEAKRSPDQRAIFIGWWAKHLNRILSNHVEFERWWGSNPSLTEDEQRMSLLIEQDYGVTLQPEQWAWWRYQLSTRTLQNLLQEHPWHESVAWQQTGSSFFNIERINTDIGLLRQGLVTYDGYRYELGDKFITMRCDKVMDASLADLKIYEAPVRNARYAIGVDVAFGRSATNDRHAVMVFRCFADKLVQVAEWTTSQPETFQVAWVLAHLAGSYRDNMINLETNGPGIEVVTQMRLIRQDIEFSHLVPGLTPTFDARRALDQARWYIFHRPDTPGAGFLYNWKSLALDTPLPTPTGWTTMGAVKEGDEVIDATGHPTKVVGTSEIKYDRKCFKITFGCGTEIIADEEHLWEVYRSHWGYQSKIRSFGTREKIRTTAQLMPGKHVIKRAAAMELSESYLRIDPYVLGVWLGGGSSQAGHFFSSGSDMVEISAQLEVAGMPLGPVHQDRTVQRRAILGLHPMLHALDLKGNKHIPPIYLRSSRSQRMALLQGLMDTDGNCTARQGQCGFTTTSTQIAAGFLELVRSLGFGVKHMERNRPTGTKTAYQFWFTAYKDDPVFRLARKAERLADPAKRRPRHHQIVSIEEVPSVPVRCIKVAAASSLYLAGAGMIPTHNTNADNKQQMFAGFRDAYSTNQLIIRSAGLMDEMMTLRQNGQSIGAQNGKKDDRAFAAGLACHAWRDWMRLSMLQQGRTYDVEMRKQKDVENAGGRVIEGIVPQWFAQQERLRTEARRAELLGDYQ